MLRWVILDPGNSGNKALRLATGDLTEFPSVFAEIGEAKIKELREKEKGRGRTLSSDFMTITKDGRDYHIVVGHAAYKYGYVTQRQGAAKYNADFLPVMIGATLAKLYENGGAIGLYIGHPSNFGHMAADITRAALGSYNIQVRERTGEHSISFDVQAAMTWDEPVGGLHNVLLNANGEWTNNDIQDGPASVYDLGGDISHIISLGVGGHVDGAVEHAERIGVLSVYRSLEESLKKEFAKQLAFIDQLPRAELAHAIETGKYRVGGGALDCKELVEQATWQYVNTFRGLHENIGKAGQPYQNIILTGGGWGALYSKLWPIVTNEGQRDAGTIHLASNNYDIDGNPLLDDIQFANVKGAGNLLRFYIDEGVIKV